MKRASYGYIVLCYIFVLNLLFFTMPVIAVDETETFTTIADSTIDLSQPTTNYGGEEELEVGGLIDWLEAYIKFDLSNAPNSFHKAELRLEFIYVQSTIQIYIYETLTSWGEFTITWNNAPAYGNPVASVIVSNEDLYNIDITDDVQSESGNWSITLTSLEMNWLRLASKQQTGLYEPPKIVYSYHVSDLPIILGITIPIVAVVAVIGGLIYYRHRKKKVQREIFTQDAPQQTPYQVKPQEREGITYCAYCGQANRNHFSFCIACGKPI